MKRPLVARIPWLLLAIAGGLAVVAMFLVVRNRTAGVVAENAAFVLVFTTMGLIGALIASRRHGNAIGWLFLAMSLFAAVAAFSGEYARYGLVTRPRSLPGAVWAAWLSDWLWLLALFAPLIFILLLFPTGHLLSPGWRWVAWAGAVFTAVASAAFAMTPRRYEDVPVRNPFGVEAMRGWAEWFDTSGYAVIVILMVAAAASVIIRFRRAKGEERQQLKWFAYAAALMAAFFILGAIFEAAGLGESWVTTVLAIPSFLAIPVGAGVAILRHRLYDIDVVINKTVVFAVLAGFITAVYLAIVVGVGAAVGSRGNIVLSIIATAIVAVTFQPVRERARHFANTLVYGNRATPYEVLSEFAERMAGAYSNEDILPRMARILGEGTGATRASVWLRVGPELRRAASWPLPANGGVAALWAQAGDEPGRPLRLVGDELPEIPGAERAVAVRHQGELLGALAVAMPPNEPLSPGQEKLISDLASQAGLVLRNVRLTEELRANLEELRASRQRIVTAQDQERRRLERNIHDGAQQQLVSLSVKLRLAEALVAKDPKRAEEMLRQLQSETSQALEDLRDLARGIYPPLLADQGLEAALVAQARKSSIPVEVQGDGVGRYRQDAEAAVYFCCLEALQNVAKYAEASAVRLRLEAHDGELTFSVSDDGRGFDPETTPKGSGLQNMSDRLAALGGSLEVASKPGAGTTVTGRVPVRELEPAR